MNNTPQMISSFSHAKDLDFYTLWVRREEIDVTVRVYVLGLGGWFLGVN